MVSKFNQQKVRNAYCELQRAIYIYVRTCNYFRLIFCSRSEMAWHFIRSGAIGLTFSVITGGILVWVKPPFPVSMLTMAVATVA